MVGFVVREVTSIPAERQTPQRHGPFDRIDRMWKSLPNVRSCSDAGHLTLSIGWWKSMPKIRRRRDECHVIPWTEWLNLLPKIRSCSDADHVTRSEAQPSQRMGAIERVNGLVEIVPEGNVQQ